MSLSTLAYRTVNFYRYIAQFYTLLSRFNLIEVIMLDVKFFKYFFHLHNGNFI